MKKQKFSLMNFLKKQSNRSFSGAQTDLVSKCVDLHGEKSSLLEKLEIVGRLKVNLDEGGLQFATVEKQASVVKASTSAAGYKYLETDLKELRLSWQAHSALVEDIDMNLEKMLRRWEQYERELCSHSQWIDQYMGLRYVKGITFKDPRFSVQIFQISHFLGGIGHPLQHKKTWPN